MQGAPENLLEYISTLQQELVSAGVLSEAYADSQALEEDYGFRPAIDIQERLSGFAQMVRRVFLVIYIKRSKVTRQKNDS